MFHRSCATGQRYHFVYSLRDILLARAAAFESWHLHAKEQRHMEDVCSKILSHMLNREVRSLASFACVVCGKTRGLLGPQLLCTDHLMGAYLV